MDDSQMFSPPSAVDTEYLLADTAAKLSIDPNRDFTPSNPFSSLHLSSSTPQLQLPSSQSAPSKDGSNNTAAVHHSQQHIKEVFKALSELIDAARHAVTKNPDQAWAQLKRCQDAAKKVSSEVPPQLRWKIAFVEARLLQKKGETSRAMELLTQAKSIAIQCRDKESNLINITLAQCIKAHIDGGGTVKPYQVVQATDSVSSYLRHAGKPIDKSLAGPWVQAMKIKIKLHRFNGDYEFEKDAIKSLVLLHREYPKWGVLGLRDEEKLNTRLLHLYRKLTPRPRGSSDAGVRNKASSYGSRMDDDNDDDSRPSTASSLRSRSHSFHHIPQHLRRHGQSPIHLAQSSLSNAANVTSSSCHARNRHAHHHAHHQHHQHGNCSPASTPSPTSARQMNFALDVEADALDTAVPCMKPKFSSSSSPAGVRVFSPERFGKSYSLSPNMLASNLYARRVSDNSDDGSAVQPQQQADLAQQLPSDRITRKGRPRRSSLNKGAKGQGAMSIDVSVPQQRAFPAVATTTSPKESSPLTQSEIMSYTPTNATPSSSGNSSRRSSLRNTPSRTSSLAQLDAADGDGPDVMTMASLSDSVSVVDLDIDGIAIADADELGTEDLDANVLLMHPSRIPPRQQTAISSQYDLSQFTPSRGTRPVILSPTRHIALERPRSQSVTPYGDKETSPARGRRWDRTHTPASTALSTSPHARLHTGGCSTTPHSRSNSAARAATFLGNRSLSNSLQDLSLDELRLLKDDHQRLAEEIDREIITKEVKSAYQEGKLHSSACSVCLDAKVDVCLMPCRHACLCARCAQGVSSCPVCRTDIEERMSIFLL